MSNRFDGVRVLPHPSGMELQERRSGLNGVATMASARPRASAPRAHVSRTNQKSLLIGKSPQMVALSAMIDRVAQSDVPVLVAGETGTGKEIVAEAIHSASSRKAGPFVVCDLSAVGSTLLESELFGHRRGAFTSAERERQGAFFRANGGTLFLDEVGELPESSQPRLLRAIERQEIKPVGEDDFRAVDVRIIAASNRDLAAETRAGRFRSDLYHRLAVVCLDLPPLRKRREDIPLLANHFLEELAVASGRPTPRLSAEAMRTLVSYNWPGNVRELKNVLQRTLSLDPDAEHVGAELFGIDAPRRPVPGVSPYSWKMYKETKDQLIDQWESEYLEDTIQYAKGNMSLAARYAGITRAHLYRLVKKHRIGGRK